MNDQPGELGLAGSCSLGLPFDTMTSFFRFQGHNQLPVKRCNVPQIEDGFRRHKGPIQGREEQAEAWRALAGPQAACAHHRARAQPASAVMTGFSVSADKWYLQMGPLFRLPEVKVLVPDRADPCRVPPLGLNGGTMLSGFQGPKSQPTCFSNSARGGRSG